MTAQPRRKRVRRRPYLASGHLIVAKAMPFLVERVTDPAVPETALSPLERTVRGWRTEILEDLGGDTVSAARRAVLDAAVGSKIILSSLDAFLFHADRAGDGPGVLEALLADERRPHEGDHRHVVVVRQGGGVQQPHDGAIAVELPHVEEPMVRASAPAGAEDPGTDRELLDLFQGDGPRFVHRAYRPGSSHTRQRLDKWRGMIRSRWSFRKPDREPDWCVMTLPTRPERKESA
jgi:hypothetical protein